MSAPLAHATFRENLGSKFRLKDGSTDFELELIEVSELRQTQQYEAFAIIFRCSSGQVLQQKIYRLEHDKAGDFEIFLVPVSKDQQGVCYEGVFNLSRGDSSSSGSAA
jgi:hypothetical protein